MRKLIPILFSLIPFSVFSQSGKITGKVIDGKTGQPLVGANVSIANPNLNGATDLNGVYAIANLKPGTYSINCSYVSYSPKIISEIIVKAGEITNLDITMLQATSASEGVVVRSRIAGENVGALLTTQKNSAGVSDGISAESIRKTPDKNTGDVIKRVSGASLQDDRFVIIRGLNDRYNAAFLNGAPLPSSESDKKAFAFDIFPANILDNLVIFKTATADMSAEFGGGIINITTKSIPSQNFTTLSLGIGYNTIATNQDKVTYHGGKTDFIGKDDGTRAIPSEIPGIEAFNNLSKIERAKYATYFDNNWALKTKKALPNSNIQFTKGYNIQKKGRDFLGLLFSVTYNNSSSYSEGERNIFVYDRSSASAPPQWADKYIDRAYTTQTLLGGLANFSLKLNSRNTINWKNIISINSDNKVIKREGTPDFSGDPEFITRVNARSFTSNQIISSQLSGNHLLNQSNLRLDWLAAYSGVKRSVPDLRQSVYFGTTSSPDFTASVPSGSVVQGNGGTHFYSNTDENISSAKVDLTQPFAMNGKKQNLVKIGISYQTRTRDFNARLLGFTTYNIGSVNFDYDLLNLPEDKIFAPENMGGKLANGTGGFTLTDGTQPTYVYDANSKLLAGYAMLDQRFGKKFRVNYGARLENFNQQLNSVNTFFTPIHIKSTKLDVLPSMNLVYSFNTKQNLRFAYSKTINRPEFRELAPFVFFDFVSRYTIEGDTSLQRAAINNFDLRYEFYPGRAQLFSVSAFYKNFTNPIELVSSPNGSRSALYQNAKSAKVYGIEVEARTLLSTLFGTSDKKALDKFSLSANAAALWSEIELNDYGLITAKDLLSRRDLQGQSPYVFNSSLGYSNDRNGFAATLSVNRAGARIYIVGTKNDVDIYEQGRTVFDFQISKSFKQGKWEIKLNAKDLLAQQQIFYYDIDSDKKYNESTDKKFSGNSFGRVISLNATYKF